MVRHGGASGSKPGHDWLLAGGSQSTQTISSEVGNLSIAGGCFHVSQVFRRARMIQGMIIPSRSKSLTFTMS